MCMITSGQRKVIGSNNNKSPFLAIQSYPSYDCVNAEITRGIEPPPFTLYECFEKYPNVKDIAFALGVTQSVTNGITQYNFWSGSTAPEGNNFPSTYLLDVNLNSGITTECELVQNILGLAWSGCLWGSPESVCSCTCPSVGPKYDAYLKHRLTVATFWNTPKYVPVQRREFLDEIQYGNQIEITVPGDFTLHLGLVVEIDVTGSSGYPYNTFNTPLNGKYWIIEIKHVASSGGTHETRLKLARMAVTSTI